MKRDYITIVVVLLLLILAIGGSYFSYKKGDDTFSALRVFTVEQGGTGTAVTPNLGDVLVGLSDGTYEPRATSTLGIGGSGGGVSDWLQANGALTPTTSIGIRVKASSTIAGLTVDGNATTTGKLIVQGTATSTFGGAVQLGLNQHLVAHGAVSDGSDGFHIDASNGTQVVNFGAGGGSNASFYGGVNIDGATRLATSLNGFAYLTNGAVTATTSGMNHSALSNLAWTSSGHTGTASTIAGFNGAGTASEYATSTPSVTAPITYSGTLGYLVGGSSGSFGCTTANTTTLGCLTSGDWNIFNNKLASTSIDTSAELAAILTDETGSAGSAVFSVSPVFTGGTAFTGIKVSASSTLGLASSTALTVSGQTYLGLASTTAISGTNLNFTNATTSASFQTPLLGIGTDYISDITGSGLTLTNGVLSATASGGGSSNWLTVAGKLTPSTTIGINVPTASSMGSTTYSGSLLLASNDGGQLGALGTAWGDLFLASGAVINFNSSDVTITHAGNQLTFNGASSGYTFNNLISGTDLTLTGLLDAGGAALEIPNGTAPTVDSVGEIAIDTTSNQLVLYGSAKKVYGDGNFYPSFTYATSTAWTGTTTIPLGAPFTGETWGAVKCFTDTGTVNVDFGDGTNWMNATTSKALNPVPTHTLSTNNTFTAGETRYARVGTPVSSPQKISCTVSKSLTAD